MNHTTVLTRSVAVLALALGVTACGSSSDNDSSSSSDHHSGSASSAPASESGAVASSSSAPAGGSGESSSATASSSASSTASSGSAEASGKGPVLNITDQTKAPQTIGDWKISGAGQLGNSISYKRGSDFAAISYTPDLTVEDTKTPGAIAAFKHNGTAIPGGYCGTNTPEPEKEHPIDTCRLAATQGSLSVTVSDVSPDEVKEFARQTQEALQK